MVYSNTYLIEQYVRQFKCESTCIAGGIEPDGGGGGFCRHGV
jgi:hypothetical protein